MKTALFFLSFTIALALSSCSDSADNASISNEKDSISYAIGLDVGTMLKRQEIDYSRDALMRGILDATDTGRTKLLTEQQIQQVMMGFQQKMMAKMQEKSNKSKADVEKFLTENRAKEGVVTTESGLQYQVITKGTGKRPTRNDKVKVHYRGTLLDGTEFDNSYARNEPLVIKVGDVIAGWTEALQMMPVGSHWKVYIPPHLGYGDRPAGPIPAGSVLLFDVELLGIEK